MYVPPTDNPLMDILMARKATGESPVKRRRSSARPRQSAAAAVAAARRKSQAKAEVPGEEDGDDGMRFRLTLLTVRLNLEVRTGDEVAPTKRKGEATPKKVKETPKKAAPKSKGKTKAKAKDDDAQAKKPRKPAASKSKKVKAAVTGPSIDSGKLFLLHEGCATGA